MKNNKKLVIKIYDMKSLLRFVLFLFLVINHSLADDFVVSDMRVEGLQRISEGTVFNYLPINIGDRIDEIRIQEAIRSLYRDRKSVV